MARMSRHLLGEFGGDGGEAPMRNISGEPWARADLFFLDHTLRHGMAVEEVAGFLGRDSEEVRAKARELDEHLIPDEG